MKETSVLVDDFKKLVEMSQDTLRPFNLGFDDEEIEFFNSTLDKAVPAKLNKGLCPKCERVPVWGNKYCWYCGQALDWSGSNFFK